MILRGDLQHLVSHDIRQVNFAQQQVQGRFEEDALELHRHGFIESDAGFVQRRLVRNDVDPGGVLQIIENGFERRV